MAPARQPTLPLPPAAIRRQPVYQVYPPRVESLESLELLVAELARITALEEHEAAQLKDDIGALTSAALGRLKINVADEAEITLADWRAKLEAAAEKFCDKHRAQILEDGRKSKDLTHGRVGWKDSPPALEPLPDFDEYGNDKILKALLKALRLHLQDVADFTDGGDRFVEVKLTWRKKDLLKAHTDQNLKLPILRKTGFTIREESEEFYITPRAGELQSQPAEKPQ